MSEQQFYHALKVDEDKCYGCIHCMNVCPTDAIRIRDGIATIRKDRCVDCGECMKACPVDAIFVVQDDFESIFDFKYRVAILPSVFIGQFSKQISENEIIEVMHSLGFTHVVPAESTVDLINEAILEMYNSEIEKPLISSFCPSIIRLIQVRFPGLVNNILPIKPPIDSTANYYRMQLINEGKKPEDIGIFYVTPCASKIATVKAPVGEAKSYVDGVINMDFLYNKVYHILNNRNNSDKEATYKKVKHLTSKAMCWSLTEGESAHMKGRCLAIDEIHNVIKFLNKVENDEIINVDFLELRACDQSCAGGVLLSENRFLTVERLKKRAKKIEGTAEEDDIDEESREFIKKNISISSIQPRPIMALDKDMATAIKKMERVRRIMCFLPGIDCGACGSPNCESLARDIVLNDAGLSNCVFMQRMMEKNRKLNPDHSLRIIEKTWGKDRLDKDCFKKGAKDEGI